MYASEASSVIESMELLPETSLQIFGGGGAGQFSFYFVQTLGTLLAWNII